MVLSQLPLVVLDRTRDVFDFKRLVEQTAAVLHEAGVPIDRLFAGMLTLHPQAVAYGVRWTPESGTFESRLSHRVMAELELHDSPLRRFVHGDAMSFRARLAADGDLGMRDLADLVKEGYTDFVGWALRWNGRSIGAVTYTTRSAAGFTAAQIDALGATHLAIEARLGTLAGWRTTGELLGTYLGADAGRRVLLGQVKRGDGQTIRAALWFSDLRGFSTLTEVLDRDELLACLNEAFELQVAAIQQAGGDVLKFIGDGLLAIFRTEDADESAACVRALEAALQATQALRQRNQARESEGRRPVGIGIALDFGDVMYGNIGGPDRLDFTVIGPTVNRAARIESVCSRLGRQVLASSEFAGRAAERLTPVGRVELKGLDGTHEVFAPRPEALP